MLRCGSYDGADDGCARADTLSGAPLILAADADYDDMAMSTARVGAFQSATARALNKLFWLPRSAAHFHHAHLFAIYTPRIGSRAPICKCRR